MTLEERGRQHALQALLTSLGDLSRYRGLHGLQGSSEGGSGGGGVGGWARAEEMYRRALRVDPSSGKVGVADFEKVFLLTSANSPTDKLFNQ